MKQEEVQEKLIMYQLLQKHLEELRNQGFILERKYLELEATRQAVNDIKSAGATRNEAIIPLGSGFFAYGKLADSSRMLVDVGADVLVNKNIADSESAIEEKKKDIERVVQQLQAEMNGVVQQINAIGMVLEKALQEMQGKQP
ncbi:MAG: prefoldin subunit alpha [Candidatus Aenigmarchaeota archaeon]|nr:prefoldin subunit alpha [Candidatus Aenigmarchaeota archaeon]